MFFQRQKSVTEDIWATNDAFDEQLESLELNQEDRLLTLKPANVEKEHTSFDQINNYISRHLRKQAEITPQSRSQIGFGSRKTILINQAIAPDCCSYKPNYNVISRRPLFGRVNQPHNSHSRNPQTEHSLRRSLDANLSQEGKGQAEPGRRNKVNFTSQRQTRVRAKFLNMKNGPLHRKQDGNMVEDGLQKTRSPCFYLVTR